MFTDNKNFYPTPKEVVFKMLDKLRDNKYTMEAIKYILEPSCGKGNIVQAYEDYYENNFKRIIPYGKKAKDMINFDVIELDENLNNLLRGQNYNIVWNDFLTFNPPRFYDLIIMNPPFDCGDKHLLRAISIQERIGGKILCVLNAETIKNTYSNDRKQLVSLLNKYNADIEFVNNAFSESERETDVEIALIYINVPMDSSETIFEKNLKRENSDIFIDDIHSLMPKMNKLEQLIFEYEMIKNSSLELFKEQLRIQKLLNGFGIKSELNICDDKVRPDKLTVNEFISKITLKFWNKFIEETDFKNRLPSKLRDNFNYNMEKQKNIAFTIDNLRYFYDELIKSIPQSYTEIVAKVFDDLTVKYHYSNTSWNKNIHMYNGWKTNNCYMIKNKNIIPCHHDYLYQIPDILKDLNIIFENISGEKDNINTKEICDKIKHCEKNIETKHFLLDSYKKETLHIKYKNQQHLKIFNILAGKGKMWLPPDFGDKQYSDMNEKEKELVKEFEFTPIEYNQLSNKCNVDFLRLE